jgi:hypothetical protein
MRLEVRDHAHTGQGARVEAALRDALARAEAHGLAPRRPVRCVLEALGVPAFTETQVGLHVLHLRAADASAPWLPGLLLREVAHAALADLGHASHDPALLQEGFAAARERGRGVGFLAAVGALNHRVRDVYAEDAAERLDAPALHAFLAHEARLAARAEGSTRLVELGHARGALQRRGLAGADEVPDEPGVAALAGGFAGLPRDPGEEELAQALVALVRQLPEA